MTNEAKRSSGNEKGEAREWVREVPANETLKAFAQIQAIEAERHPQVLLFREKVLGNQLLPLEEIEAWIKAKFKEEGGIYTLLTLQLPPWASLDALEENWREILSEHLKDVEIVRKEWETLEYPRIEDEPRGVVRGIRCDGVLGWLKNIAKDLGTLYQWSEADAVAFVLAGVTPVPPLARISTRWIAGRGTHLQTITFHVFPWVSPTEVARFYREVRRETPLGRYARVRAPKPLTEKGRALAIFLAETPGLSWRERMKLWNEKYPKWAYVHRTTFRRDAILAYRKVTGRAPPK